MVFATPILTEVGWGGGLRCGAYRQGLRESRCADSPEFLRGAPASMSPLPCCRHLRRRPSDRLPVVLMPTSCLVQGSRSAGYRCGCSRDRSSGRCAPIPPLCRLLLCRGSRSMSRRSSGGEAVGARSPCAVRCRPGAGDRTLRVKIAMRAPVDLTARVHIWSLMRPNTIDEAIVRAVLGVGTGYVRPRGKCPELGV